MTKQEIQERIWRLEEEVSQETVFLKMQTKRLKVLLDTNEYRRVAVVNEEIRQSLLRLEGVNKQLEEYQELLKKGGI